MIDRQVVSLVYFWNAETLCIVTLNAERVTHAHRTWTERPEKRLYKSDKLQLKFLHNYYIPKAKSKAALIVSIFTFRKVT